MKIEVTLDTVEFNGRSQEEIGLDIEEQAKLIIRSHPEIDLITLEVSGHSLSVAVPAAALIEAVERACHSLKGTRCSDYSL